MLILTILEKIKKTRLKVLSIMANYQEAKVNKYAMKKIKICRKADLKNIKNK